MSFIVVQDEAQYFNPFMATKFMSYNIGIDNPAEPNHSWIYRKKPITAMINYADPDIIGGQEMSVNQVSDVLSYCTEKNYEWFGVSREDGRSKGFMNPIFYKKLRYQALDNGNFWLSEAPEIPGSSSWDCNSPNVVVWLKLYDRRTRKPFYVFNFQLDKSCDYSKREIGLLLLKKIQTIAGFENYVVFSSLNNQTTSIIYKNLTFRYVQDEQGKYLGLDDTRTMISDPHFGPEGTNFGFEVNKSQGIKNDFIFSRQLMKAFIKNHSHLSFSDGGFYPSSHLPVCVDVQWK